ncbi:MAG: hypothetical protein GC190_07245 [Alphaproteobacteria bacterium]|nr:hypothetical protein [Alphaproteobacteria bacterium]
MRRLLPRALALAAVAGFLSACSSFDASKPGTWIDTIAGGGSEANGGAKTAPPPPSAGDKPPPVTTATTQTASSSAGTTSATSDKPGESALPSEKADGQPVDYPNLAAQPDAQTVGTTESQRREIRDSLVRDREDAQHSADVLRGGTETPAAPPPPAKPADATPADGSTSDAKPAEGSDSTPASDH